MKLEAFSVGSKCHKSWFQHDNCASWTDIGLVETIHTVSPSELPVNHPSNDVMWYYLAVTHPGTENVQCCLTLTLRLNRRSQHGMALLNVRKWSGACDVTKRLPIQLAISYNFSDDRRPANISRQEH